MFIEAIFIDEFVKYYMGKATEYDLSHAFDEYIDDVVVKNSNDDNQFIIKTYEQVKINVGIELNMNVRVSCILYDTFYREVDEAVEAFYNGDAEPNVYNDPEYNGYDVVPFGGFEAIEGDIEPMGVKAYAH